MFFPKDKSWQNQGHRFVSPKTTTITLNSIQPSATINNHVDHFNGHTYNTVIDDKNGPTYEDPDEVFRRDIYGQVNKKLLLIHPISLTAIFIRTKYQQEWNDKGILIKSDEVKTDLNLLNTNNKLLTHHQDLYYEPIISAQHLLQLMSSRKKVCLFEVSSDRIDESKIHFKREHIESAKLMYFTNLSHIGIPVHPLQFQRYARNLGVDSDCHVILYDKGELVWSTYALWIFHTFGHQKVQILDGGMASWKRMQKKSSLYHTEAGVSGYFKRLGNFKSKWSEQYILTFDDVLSNFDKKQFDLVDGQSRAEYNGTSGGNDLILGHIRSAQNIPIEEVFNWKEERWMDEKVLDELFKKTGLLPSRPIAIYCTNSLRASTIWVSLYKMKYQAAVYFSGWPEWLIRAPDYLKVIPELKLN
uniref:Sulfurtransferase n=1 Tax=Rhabditophanes sp. KR3021 TaxID=114890 RepID=A0AC35TK72_9BILA